MSPLTRRRFVPVVLLALPAVLPACADLDFDDDRRGGYRDRRVEFRCDDDRRFEVTYRDRGDEAEVRTRDRSYRLEYEGRNGGSRRYGDGDVQLFVDRDEARLRIKDERDYSDCEARR